MIVLELPELKHGGSARARGDHSERRRADSSLVCERPGPCYGRAVFLGDDLAVDGSPCSYAPDGQGALLATVQQRR